MDNKHRKFSLEYLDQQHSQVQQTFSFCCYSQSLCQCLNVMFNVPKTSHKIDLHHMRSNGIYIGIHQHQGTFSNADYEIIYIYEIRPNT